MALHPGCQASRLPGVNRTGSAVLTEELGQLQCSECWLLPDVSNSWDTAKQHFYRLLGVVLAFLLPVSSHC